MNTLDKLYNHVMFSQHVNLTSLKDLLSSYNGAFDTLNVYYVKICLNKTEISKYLKII